MAVTLYLAHGGRAKKAAETAIPGDLWPKIKQKHITIRKDVPARGHMVLQVGGGKPSIEQEHFAARKGAFIVCLPEAGKYLEAKVRNALDAGHDLILLDAGLMNVSVI
jgi:hypothetical protein